MKLPALFKNSYFLVPLLILVIYITRFRFDKTHYFDLLADAFLHGRLNIIPRQHLQDLVLFNGKYYLYWPPVPAVMMMPFVALFGPNLPDAIISSLIGAVNVWLFMKIITQLSTRFLLDIRLSEIIWAGLFWGLGTVHFYMAANGDVWHFSQVTAQLFLLSAVYFFLQNSRWWQSGLFFALAVYTRNDLVFSGIFFLFLYFGINRDQAIAKAIKPAMQFILPFMICSILNLWYNEARFGSMTDNGLDHHLMSAYFKPDFMKYGFFSWHYFPHNFYTEVMHWPSIIRHDPFIREEPEGFGFIWASPFFLWLIPAIGLYVYLMVTRSSWRRYRIICTGSLLAAIPIAITIFLIMGTGWRQFAARYTLDFQFFLLIFLLFSWPYLRRIPYARQISMIMIVCAVIIQYIGAANN